MKCIIAFLALLILAFPASAIDVEQNVTFTTGNTTFTSANNISLTNISVYSDALQFNDANLSIIPESGNLLITFTNITTIDNLTFTNNASFTNFSIQNGFANYTFANGVNYGLNNSTAYAANNTSASGYIILNQLVPSGTYSLEIIVDSVITAVRELLSRIPYQLYMLFIVVDILLVYYSFTHTDSAYYTDIIASLFAMLLSFIIAHNSIMGMLFFTPLQSVMRYNTYTSVPLGIIFSILGVLMLIIFVTKILDLTHHEIDKDYI